MFANNFRALQFQKMFNFNPHLIHFICSRLLRRVPKCHRTRRALNGSTRKLWRAFRIPETFLLSWMLLTRLSTWRWLEERMPKRWLTAESSRRYDRFFYLIILIFRFTNWWSFPESHQMAETFIPVSSIQKLFFMFQNFSNQDQTFNFHWSQEKKSLKSENWIQSSFFADGTRFLCYMARSYPEVIKEFPDFVRRLMLEVINSFVLCFSGIFLIFFKASNSFRVFAGAHVRHTQHNVPSWSIWSFRQSLLFGWSQTDTGGDFQG